MTTEKCRVTRPKEKPLAGLCINTATACLFDEISVAVLAFHPLGSAATTRPGLSGGRITVFRRHLATTTRGFAGALATKQISGGQAEFVNYGTGARHGILNRVVTGGSDLLLDSGFLGEKLLEIAHVSGFQNIM